MTSNSLPHNAPPAPPGSAPSASSSATTPRPATRRVVDAATRMLHWLMALSFTGAYITADGERWRLVHVTLGYTLAGLLVARVLWGLFGPRQVRLSVLWRKLQGFPAWLQSLVAVRSPSALQAAWRPGKNLLMALAGGLILVSIVPLTLSGYAVWDEWGGEWLEEVHEFFGNAMLMVVLAHIGVVLGLSLLRRRNLVAPMLTGRTAGAGPDLVRRPFSGVAALLLAAVLAFWACQWQTAPLPGDGAHAAQSHHDDDDDD